MEIISTDFQNSLNSMIGDSSDATTFQFHRAKATLEVHLKDWLESWIKPLQQFVRLGKRDRKVRGGHGEAMISVSMTQI
jgi:hypothetical protein